MADRQFEVNDETYLKALCRATPYHIVEQVLADPTERALEPRTVEGTVLSADLVGFTAVSDRLDQADDAALSAISGMLDRLFTAIQHEALFPMGGRVTEFGGDALTVVFWGPDHARRAVEAGLRIPMLVRREVAGSEGDDLRSLRVRVGIASGKIRLRVLGDLTRRISFCGGEATHRALVLQSAAGVDDCLVDRATIDAAGDGVSFRAQKGGEAFVVEDLQPRVDDQPFESLSDRVAERTADKIAILEPFVPGPLARRLRTTPRGWRIEPEIRRGVVIAFADITGSYTDDPEKFEAGQQLSLSLMRAFHKYEGLVLKCTAIENGHRVMLLFGAHRPAGNDSERAALAAVEAITRLRAFEHVTPGDISIRIGLHRGSIFFGGVGSRSKHDLTALGDSVNVAARAASKAEPFQVVATSAVAEEIADIFSMTDLGDVELKGKARPVSLHQIHAVKGGRAHYAQRRTHRRFSAGRDEQESQLTWAVRDASNRQAASIGICGEPGTGKSHILSNCVDSWIDVGGSAIVSRCLYAHRTVPLAPVRELFDAFLGVSEDASDSERFSRIRERLGSLGLGQNQELLSFLQPVRRPDGLNESLLDLSDPDATDRLIHSIVQVVERRVEQMPMMYVLEDIHFADSLTLRLIEQLTKIRRDRPYLFITTYRPEPRLDHVRTCFDSELLLPSLELDDVANLLRHETGGNNVDEDLLHFLWQRGQGNPEHLIQTLRFLSDRWLIRVDDHGQVKPTVVLDALQDIVPPTWAQVAVARLDGTTELERRVLRTASAIGFSFDTEVLTGVEQDLPGDVVQDSLVGLENQLWVAPELQSRMAYRFRDAVTRSVAYSIIPEGERQALHRRIAEAIERRIPNTTSLLPALAHHWERAGDLETAARLWDRVIEQTRKRGLVAEVDKFVARIQAIRDRLSR